MQACEASDLSAAWLSSGELLCSMVACAADGRSKAADLFSHRARYRTGRNANVSLKMDAVYQDTLHVVRVRIPRRGQLAGAWGQLRRPSSSGWSGCRSEPRRRAARATPRTLCIASLHESLEVFRYVKTCAHAGDNREAGLRSKGSAGRLGSVCALTNA